MIAREEVWMVTWKGAAKCLPAAFVCVCVYSCSFALNMAVCRCTRRQAGHDGEPGSPRQRERSWRPPLILTKAGSAAKFKERHSQASGRNPADRDGPRQRHDSSSKLGGPWNELVCSRNGTALALTR